MARPGLMISRIFAYTLARRLVAIFVAGVLAWVGIGESQAAVFPFGPCNVDDSCTIYQAQAELGTSKLQAFCSNRPAGATVNITSPVARSTEYINAFVVSFTCKGDTGSTVWTNVATFFKSGCPTGEEWNNLRGTCQKTCSSQSPRTVSYQSTIPSGSYACIDGCTARVTPTGDGTYTQMFLGGEPSHCLAMPKDCSDFGAGYGINYGTSMCQPPFVECEANEVKDPISGTCTQGCEPGKLMDANGVCKPEQDHCPPGNVKSPSGGCLPGDGQCAVGEAKGKDGTCKRDSDGDGTPDAGEEEGTTDETFSGGDNCSSPPACSGSPIMCGMARIQWRIDCNTRKDHEVSGGACNAMPVCIGRSCDAVEYAQLIQQWKSSCALEKLVGKDSDGSGQPEWTKVGGMNQNPGSGELASDKPTIGEKEFNTDDLDSSGFGGGSCVGLASVSGQGVVGSSYAQTFASPPAAWCNFISNLRASLIIISAALSCFIIARGL